MINNLSAELDVMRPSMIETGLETISYNINRKNKDLKFFEFGKTYHNYRAEKYEEREHLSLYLTGQSRNTTWKSKATESDFFFAKGVAKAVLQLCGLELSPLTEIISNNFYTAITYSVEDKTLATIGQLSSGKLKTFDIRQPVFFIDIDWLQLLQLVTRRNITYREVSKWPFVQRDIAVVLNQNVSFSAMENAVQNLRINKLKEVQLFDIFESDKLGAQKKSLAVSFTFIDEEKTLTDKEIDEMMNKIILSFEKELDAEIRK